MRQQDKAGDDLLGSRSRRTTVIVIDGERYLDSGEAARRLGVKRETLYA